jgi:S1-C subfamily serine protease
VLASVALFVLGVLAGHSISRVGPERAAADPAPPSRAEPAALRSAPAGPEEATPIPQGLSADERRDIDVFRRASDSVVYIVSAALRRDFFTLDVHLIPQGAGTGFVWDGKGHIVTNYHVVGDGDRFSVTLSDQSEWPATVVGVAPDKDLAVIRIEAPADRLVPLAVGRSGDLVVGQKVLAVGNPFGLDHTLTTGVVSALGREIVSPNGRTIRDVIQTDAAINPGNSGGPLLDSSGRLIGINTAIQSPTGAYAGIGFAVPVDIVRALVPQLIERGRAIRPGIGADFLADRYAARLRLRGVIVREVAEGGPAARAGIQGIGVTRRGRYVLGDVVVAVNGEAVTSVDDLLYAFERAGVGGRVALTVQRDGEEREVRVQLAGE